MTTLVIEKIYPAPVETVFEFITRHENLLKWWGHDGMTLSSEQLDFTQPGPWHSEMTSAEGNRYKMSGEVREVKAPNLVAFTWGWHDENDARGHESNVTFEVTDAGDGNTKLTIRHVDLPDDESAKNHKMGWNATLSRLDRQLN